MTIPGVGPVVSLAFISTVDVPARFRNSKAVARQPTYSLTSRSRLSALAKEIVVKKYIVRNILCGGAATYVSRELDIVADATLRMGGHRRLSGSVRDLWFSPVCSRPPPQGPAHRQRRR